MSIILSVDGSGYKKQEDEEAIKKEALIAKEYGAQISGKIFSRIQDLIHAENLYVFSKIRSAGLHPLHGDRKGQWAIKLNGNRRMIIIIPEGRGDLASPEYLETVTRVRIEELCIDYH